ncbi:MAG: hypothetical protein LBB94_03085 [Clostridiales bacterium]|jgi:hypothetical protein|nr:hypothetical protein [Clostridiales bacterium]
MKQERMKILELLDQGKITAAEAASLLEALKTNDAQEPFWDEDAAKRVHEKVNKFSQNVEGLSKDVGDKLEAVFKEIEPKLRAATKVVVEKTAVIVDEISKSLSETLKNLEENGTEEKCCCEEEKNTAESGECHEEKTEETGDKPIEN